MIYNSHETQAICFKRPILAARSGLDKRPIEKCNIFILDVFKITCSFLDIQSLGRVSLVSRSWYQMASSDLIWPLFVNHYKAESLDEVYDSIEKQMIKKDANLCCRFAQILFEGNLRSFKIEQHLRSDNFDYSVTFKLRKSRVINFNHSYISNIFIPKNVSFCITCDGFDFVPKCWSGFDMAIKDDLERNPIYIGYNDSCNSKFSYFKCNEFMVDYYTCEIINDKQKEVKYKWIDLNAFLNALSYTQVNSKNGI